MKRWLIICILVLATVLAGCGKPGGELITPTQSAQPNPDKDKEKEPVEKEPVEEESVEDKALAAYKEILKNAPAVGNSEELGSVYMNYEENLVKYGEHYDTYAFYDINSDGVSELIATTTINFKWVITYVFTYVNGQVVLLDDPLNPAGQGTFNQNFTANGVYFTAFCKDKHIHNIWRGNTPVGEVEDNFAYELDGKELKQVNCTVSSEELILFSDIAKANDFGVRIPAEPVKSMQITVDYLKVPELYSKFISADDWAAYEAIVKAWLNYEPKVKVENPSKQNYLWGMLKECFFIIYSDFDEDRGITYDQEYVYFPYVSKTKEEHDAYITAFEKRVNFFFEGISEDEKGVELAKHIYINFNHNIDYNYDIVENNNFTFKNSSGYTALMEGTGVCMSFARAYSYLLRQAGLEAFDVSGFSNIAGVDNHQWSALKVDDKYYFVDPTWDYQKDPSCYEYFCFGMNKREANGYPEENMNLCENGDIKMKKYVYIEREDMQ